MTTPQSKIMEAPQVKVDWVLITPELAGEWLKNNPHNRNLRDRVVAKYAADMEADGWLLIGDPIRRADDGTLLDGQHRLHAVVQSGRSIWMAVVEGLDPSTQMAMDTGSARAYADQLRIQGGKNTTVHAALLRWVVQWERGERLHLNNTAPSHRELHAAELAYPDLAEVAHFGAAAARNMPLPATVYAMAYWLLNRIDTESATDFLCRISDGVELSRDHPAYAFRARFQRDREARRAVTKPQHLALLIIAWNAYRDGRPLTKLQLPAAGLNSSNYPVPR